MSKDTEKKSKDSSDSSDGEGGDGREAPPPARKKQKAHDAKRDRHLQLNSDRHRERNSSPPGSGESSKSTPPEAQLRRRKLLAVNAYEKAELMYMCERDEIRQMRRSRKSKNTLAVNALSVRVATSVRFELVNSNTSYFDEGFVCIFSLQLFSCVLIIVMVANALAVWILPDESSAVDSRPPSQCAKQYTNAGAVLLVP
eukprot:6179480-Pleurochrysis_carterae.AAC.1